MQEHRWVNYTLLESGHMHRMCSQCGLKEQLKSYGSGWVFTVRPQSASPCTPVSSHKPVEADAAFLRSIGITP